MTPEQIRRAAEEELEHEQFRHEVEQHKRKLRLSRGRSWFRRLLALIPFTITRKQK
jgi:hypothetical protein